MSVIPVGGKLSVTYTSSNTYDVPSYLGYVIATPTGNADYTLPVRANVNVGAPMILKNRSNFTITISDDDENVLATVAPLGTASFVSTSSEWADFSAVDDTLNIPDDLKVKGYLSVGSLTAPANTVDGAISTTYVAPTSQAFGAVTANGTSGLLTFTSTLAGNTIATAVVTNASCRATSLVFLEQQSYSGTIITNGIPTWSVSARTNGSFTITLLNNSANAMTGSVQVAFMIIN